MDRSATDRYDILYIVYNIILLTLHFYTPDNRICEIYISSLIRIFSPGSKIDRDA